MKKKKEEHKKYDSYVITSEFELPAFCNVYVG